MLVFCTAYVLKQVRHGLSADNSAETSNYFQQATRRHAPESNYPNSHHCEKLKSHNNGPKRLIIFPIVSWFFCNVLVKLHFAIVYISPPTSYSYPYYLCSGSPYVYIY